MLADFRGDWPVSHCCHLFWVGGHAYCADDPAQNAVSLEQVALFQMQLQATSAEGLEDLLQICQGALEVSCMHKEIIKVNHTAALGNTSQNSSLVH